MSCVDPSSVVGQFEGERNTYSLASLETQDVDKDPLVQLRTWLTQAEEAAVNEPTAMTLTTSGAGGRLHSRTVLLRQLTSTGLVFFTNHNSNKGIEISANPRCACQFLWLDLQRQVRVEGVASVMDDRTADEYFAGRPRPSQVGAWASPQSQVLNDRAELEQRVRDVEARFADAESIPRPSFWGGYVIEPDLFEFWQGRPSRLHDRVRYSLDAVGGWTIERLAP